MLLCFFLYLAVLIYHLPQRSCTFQSCFWSLAMNSPTWIGHKSLALGSFCFLLKYYSECWNLLISLVLVKFSSVDLVVSDSLHLHRLQHARPLSSVRVYDSCPLESRWCPSTISSVVTSSTFNLSRFRYPPDISGAVYMFYLYRFFYFIFCF